MKKRSTPDLYWRWNAERTIGDLYAGRFEYRLAEISLAKRWYSITLFIPAGRMTPAYAARAEAMAVAEAAVMRLFKTGSERLPQAFTGCES